MAGVMVFGKKDVTHYLEGKTIIRLQTLSSILGILFICFSYQHITPLLANLGLLHLICKIWWSRTAVHAFPDPVPWFGPPFSLCARRHLIAQTTEFCSSILSSFLSLIVCIWAILTIVNLGLSSLAAFFLTCIPVLVSILPSMRFADSLLLVFLHQATVLSSPLETTNEKPEAFSDLATSAARTSSDTSASAFPTTFLSTFEPTNVATVLQTLNNTDSDAAVPSGFSGPIADNARPRHDPYKRCNDTDLHAIQKPHDKMVPVNGCGVGSWAGFLPGSKKFRNCCNNHDLCFVR